MRCICRSVLRIICDGQPVSATPRQSDSGHVCVLRPPWPDDAVGEAMLLVQLVGVVLAPLAERQQDRLEAEAEAGRRIFDARGHFGEDLAADETVLFHFAKLLD